MNKDKDKDKNDIEESINLNYDFDTNRFKPFMEDIKNKNFNHHEMLTASVKNLITPEDSNLYTPQNFILFPTRYPSAPPILKSEVLEKFDLHTLMFIFFIQNDPIAKHLAGKELVKKGWMYSKRWLTWFQLIPPAKVHNEKSIEGKFRIWDFEKEWTVINKKDFKFELEFMECFDDKKEKS